MPHVSKAARRAPRQGSGLAQACGAPRGWHGHLARHEGSPAVALAEWRRAPPVVADQHMAEASDVRAGWRHPRRLWARLAESALCEWRGAGAAQDRPGRRGSKHDFVTWCTARFACGGQ